jgi:tetratricopeptide (TPR) repeat protein
MKYLQRLLIFMLILAPIAVAMAVHTASEPLKYLQAAEEVSTSEKSGDRKGEISALQQVIIYQPWRADVWEKIGNLQFVTGNYQDAINTYVEASKLGELSMRELINEGKSWKESGDFEKAKTFYRQASESGSDDIDLFMETAKAQEEINDSIGTLATLLRAYKLAPNDKGVNFQLGVQFAASQPDNAIKFLTTAKVDNSYTANAEDLISVITNSKQLGESADRYIYIGQELSQFGEWQAAASAFNSATVSDKENGIAWALLGEAVQHVGGNGYDDLAKGLELNPQSDIVNGLMAMYYRRQQKYEMAINYLYKALENNPNESTWQIEIGNTIALTGDLSNALNHLQVATMMEPDNWIPWQSLATFSISHNYFVSTIGVDAARKALMLVPGSPVLLDIMGSAYLVIGDYDSAERFYLQANKASPNQEEILYHLGQLYLQKNEKAQAFDYLRAAAENATDSRIRDAANLLLQQNGGG